MAVTKETYTVSPTWTASGLASAFRDAFIDAGLMTEWYDSFLSGTIENRILEVKYDESKTFGKTYYWFQFTTTGVFFAIASGWNTGTKVPTGTQYLDFYATTTNATTNHFQFVTLVSTTGVNLVRYTSAIDADVSWFLIRSGTTAFNFAIAPATTTLQPWINLNRVIFNGLLTARSYASGNAGSLTFRSYYALRRSYNVSGAFRGLTSVADYTTASTAAVPNVVQRYFMYGYGNASSTNWNGSTWGGGPTVNSVQMGIVLPYGMTLSVPEYAANEFPVCAGISSSAYIADNLPSDFGIAAHYADRTMAAQDTFIVTASSEEWEIVEVTNTAGTASLAASPMFLARVV